MQTEYHYIMYTCTYYHLVRQRFSVACTDRGTLCTDYHLVGGLVSPHGVSPVQTEHHYLMYTCTDCHLVRQRSSVTLWSVTCTDKRTLCHVYMH